jgi:cell division protein FtsL
MNRTFSTIEKVIIVTLITLGLFFLYISLTILFEKIDILSAFAGITLFKNKKKFYF